MERVAAVAAVASSEAGQRERRAAGGELRAESPERHLVEAELLTREARGLRRRRRRRRSCWAGMAAGRRGGWRACAEARRRRGPTHVQACAKAPALLETDGPRDGQTASKSVSNPTLAIQDVRKARPN